MALVTGASHGIGAATARLLASLGAGVAVNYHHDDTAAAAVPGGIRAAGGHTAALRADVADAGKCSGWPPPTWPRRWSRLAC